MHRARRPASTISPRRGRGSRLRRFITTGAGALATAAVLSLGAPAGALAATPNAGTTIGAALSASGGAVGDRVVLDLAARGGDDVYATTVGITYDSAVVALDTTAVASTFPGMYSVTGVEGAVDFTVTRLGTSSGKTGDVPLGSLAFVAKSPGSARISVDAATIIDSALGRTQSSPALGLAYTVESVSPEEPTAPEGQPTSPPPVSVTGIGSGVPDRGASVETGPAPQSSAAPTNTAPAIVVSPATPRAGERVVLSGRGLAASTAHRVELHSDPAVLGETRTDADGSFAIEATIPATIPPGEHEIVVLVGGLPVATLPVTVREASGATPGPSPSATVLAAEIADDTPASVGGAASTASDGGPPTGVLAAVLAAAAALVATVVVVAFRRARRRAREGVHA